MRKSSPSNGNYVGFELLVVILEIHEVILKVSTEILMPLFRVVTSH
jgi:hypothetical protein